MEMGDIMLIGIAIAFSAIGMTISSFSAAYQALNANVEGMIFMDSLALLCAIMLGWNLRSLL